MPRAGFLGMVVSNFLHLGTSEALPCTYLVIYGLDTFAKVTLNNEILVSENAFHMHLVSL